MPDQDPAKALTEHCSMRAERHLSTCMIRLHGEFDLTCEERFQDELGATLDSEIERLVLDLRGLGFIDSTGLRMLVQLDNLAKQDGFDFAVLCGSGLVRRAPRETGLDGILPVVDPAGAVPASESAI
jgi:anti-sigma B factor antagonist